MLTPTGPDTPSRWLDDAVVTVDDGGWIAAVGPFHPGVTVDEDLRPGVLSPGFVDAHLHYPQTRVVGGASGPLLEWLDTVVFPEEARFADADYAAAVAADFCRSLVRAGTTCAMVYGPVQPLATDVLLRTMSSVGLRGVAGPVLMDRDCPEALRLPADQALPALRALAETWHGHDEGRLQVAVIPRFAPSCSPELLRGAGDLAAELDLQVTTHLSEHPDEVELVRSRFGSPDYLSVYEDAGLLRRGAVFAHCIHPTDSEWRRMADAGAVVAHCPDSNAFLGSGHMPLDVVRGHGVPLAIGTDVAAGRTFRVPRVLSSAYDNARHLGLRPSPHHLLWLGTRGGALALGQPGVGALETGLDADMTLHTVPPWAEGVDAVLGWLLFDHDAPPADRTWVRGREVWRA